MDYFPVGEVAMNNATVRDSAADDAGMGNPAARGAAVGGAGVGKGAWARDGAPTPSVDQAAVDGRAVGNAAVRSGPSREAFAARSTGPACARTAAMPNPGMALGQNVSW